MGGFFFSYFSLTIIFAFGTKSLSFMVAEIQGLILKNGWMGGWMTERGEFYKLLAEVIILVWTLVHFLILEIH